MSKKIMYQFPRLGWVWLRQSVPLLLDISIQFGANLLFTLGLDSANFLAHSHLTKKIKYNTFFFFVFFFQCRDPNIFVNNLKAAQFNQCMCPPILLLCEMRYCLRDGSPETRPFGLACLKTQKLQQQATFLFKVFTQYKAHEPLKLEGY